MNSIMIEWRCWWDSESSRTIDLLLLSLTDFPWVAFDYLPCLLSFFVVVQWFVLFPFFSRRASGADARISTVLPRACRVWIGPSSTSVRAEWYDERAEWNRCARHCSSEWQKNDEEPSLRIIQADYNAERKRKKEGKREKNRKGKTRSSRARQWVMLRFINLYFQSFIICVCVCFCVCIYHSMPFQLPFILFFFFRMASRPFDMRVNDSCTSECTDESIEYRTSGVEGGDVKHHVGIQR